MSSPQKQVDGIHAWFVVVVALAAAAGYGWGSMGDRAAADDGRGVISASGRRESSPEARASSPTVHKFVREVLKGSMDERQQWQHVRSFTEAEVKGAIADLEKLDRYLIASWELEAMLFYRWAELDPVAANAAAASKAMKSPFHGNFSRCRQAVIAAWINQGGAVAAWNAVRDEGEMWACTRSVPGEVSPMIVASLSDRDDAFAFKEVLRLNDENCLVAEDLCVARASKASASPESRAAFLAAAATHPEPYVLDCAREALFEHWAKKDVAAARAGALALSLDRESLESLNRMIDSLERDKAREAERDTP